MIGGSSPRLKGVIAIFNPPKVCVAASPLFKTGIDFRNWVYTMNVMQLKVGDRYMADVMSICNSLIESGGKFPDSEKGERSETKEDEKTNQEGI